MMTRDTHHLRSSLERVFSAGTPFSTQEVWRPPASEHCLKLGEGRQLYQIIFGHGFQMAPGLAPCGQSADDHKNAEPLVHQYVRHPGARGLARSSTVQINVLIFGKVLDLFLKIVRLDANR